MNFILKKNNNINCSITIIILVYSLLQRYGAWKIPETWRTVTGWMSTRTSCSPRLTIIIREEQAVAETGSATTGTGPSTGITGTCRNHHPPVQALPSAWCRRSTGRSSISDTRRPSGKHGTRSNSSVLTRRILYARPRCIRGVRPSPVGTPNAFYR